MKKLLALVLVLAMAFALLAACADPDTPDEPPATDDPPAVVDDDPPATTNEDDTPPVATGATSEFVQPPANWDEPFDQTVLIRAAAPHGVNWFFEDGDDIGNSPWTRLWYDELNVQVEWEFTPVTDEYVTRLQLSIAAGDLPDVFHIPVEDPFMFRNLVSHDMLLDLMPAYQNYASQRIRDFELTDPDTIQNFIVDGQLFALPRYYYGQIDQPWHMWVRKDWFEAEGSPEIRTVDDLEDLMHAFIDNHGAAYGIHVDSDLRWLLRTAPMWGAYIGELADNGYFWRPDETGRLRPGITFPEFEVALENWARWFDEGLINPDFMTIDQWGDNGVSEVVNARVGIMCWWQWWGWWGGNNVVVMQDNYNAYFVPFNLPTVGGTQPARGQVFWANNGTIAASADFQNPAALMKVLSMNDHMVFSPDANLTPDQLEYFMGNGREHGMSPAFQMIDPQADLLQFQHVLHAMETGDTSELFTTGMQFKHRDSLHIQEALAAGQIPEDINAFGAYLQMGFDGSAYARSQHLFDTGRIVQTALWGEIPEEFLEVGATADMLMEAIMLIIIGARPVSDWPDIIEEWYAQGGQVKEDAVNRHFG
ncbi:MAG: extracellular solute-binding protein [Oscillospiraceae bacterium]|nr:extracellular solute-binding protein [Oscillospiraceae bacterium]